MHSYLLTVSSRAAPIVRTFHTIFPQGPNAARTTLRLHQLSPLQQTICFRRNQHALASNHPETFEIPSDTPPPPTVRALRTNLENPTDHTKDLEGFFYTVPPAHVEKLFGGHTLPSEYRNQIKTFRECSFMIRQPALEIMESIKNTNFSFPVVRYVLFGPDGAGKTMALAHVLHYFFTNRWIVLHAPMMQEWNRHYKEVQDSTFKRGRIDLPLVSIAWLQHFLLQNGELLKDPETKLRTHQTYTWSKREETPQGSALIDVVELGIKRPRYANDTIGVLIKELKLLASEGVTKLATVLSGANALYSATKIPRVDHTTVPPETLSLFCHFRSALKNDWTNGAVVMSADRRFVFGDGDGDGGHFHIRSRTFPRFLFRKTGWEEIDPFVPVYVPDYKDKELTNIIDYYLEQRWLQHPMGATERGREELKFLCGMNGRDLVRMVARL